MNPKLNPKLRLLLILLGITILMLLIPKPYSYSFHSDCHPYIHLGSNSGWCIGIIYPINEETRDIAEPGSMAAGMDKGFCVDTKQGFECKGYPIFESMILAI